MSLKELLGNQRDNVKRLKVNVIEEVRKGLYIIEDDSTAIFFEAIEEHCQFIEVNKALEISKPVAASRNTIKLKSHLNTFRKTKKFDIKNNHEKLIEELRNVAKKEKRVKVNETPKYENNVISYEDSIRGSKSFTLFETNFIYLSFDSSQTSLTFSHSSFFSFFCCFAYFINLLLCNYL